MPKKIDGQKWESIPSLQGIKLLTANEVAEFLRIEIGTLYKYTHQKLIRFHKWGKYILFKESDVLEFVEKGKCATVAELGEAAFSNLKKGRK